MRRLRWQSRLREPGLRRGGKRGDGASSEASLVGQEKEDNFLCFFFWLWKTNLFFTGMAAWMYVFIIVKGSYSFMKVIGPFNQRSLLEKATLR
jgi:hypothetical protein